jgi:hypothetical protein
MDEHLRERIHEALHHLPDYVGAIQRLSAFLKKGGAMCLDHEASPFSWKNEPQSLSNFETSLFPF